MFVKQLELLLCLMTCHVSFCQRRIEGGFVTTTDKPYVVYLVKAPLSEKDYDSWLCGGALVTDKFILTSAACVEDVKYLYAIAGYNKYISDANIDEDECTSNKKKKIIFTCVPISYDFNYDLVEKWANIDIALAEVESSYNFEDETYLELCSYIPNTIPINYDSTYVINETDCIVMGWGSRGLWRKEGDKKNYNAKTLRYTPTKVLLKDTCLKEYKHYAEMQPIIKQYMICTKGTGIIDDAGQPQLNTIDNLLHTELLDGCLLDGDDRRMGERNESCNKNNGGSEKSDDMNARRAVAETNRTHHNNTTDKKYYNYTKYDYIKKAVFERRSSRTRRNGICQNDHGGPLVSWVGSTEIVIGVASVFGLSEDNKCSGPSLHTSTESNAAFITCVIHSRNDRRSPLCDSPPNVRGFDMIKNHISWKDHPAGPAENELSDAKF